MPDFINSMKDKNKINKYEIKDYWIDVGTKESLVKAEKEWKLVISDNDLVVVAARKGSVGIAGKNKLIFDNYLYI